MVFLTRFPHSVALFVFDVQDGVIDEATLGLGPLDFYMYVGIVHLHPIIILDAPYGIRVFALGFTIAARPGERPEYSHGLSLKKKDLDKGQLITSKTQDMALVELVLLRAGIIDELVYLA
jgi:hypothetical protein